MFLNIFLRIIYYSYTVSDPFNTIYDLYRRWEFLNVVYTQGFVICSFVRVFVMLSSSLFMLPLMFYPSS